MVRDFVESCKKYNIKPGLYYSTGCNGYCGISDDKVKPEDYKTPWYHEYVQMVERQLAEIWGNYGELFELWFDEGVIPHEQGGPDVISLIRKYQPNAICFQGHKEHFQNLRWIGNERGLAPLNCWSTAINNTCSFGGTVENDAIGMGSPDGTCWIPAETDMANRKQNAAGGGWGNSNLLIGMGINQYGHFEDAGQFEKFGQLIKELYKYPVASCRGTGTEFELLLNDAEEVRNLVIMEDIHYGERTRKFTVEILGKNGWESFFEANLSAISVLCP